MWVDDGRRPDAPTVRGPIDRPGWDELSVVGHDRVYVDGSAHLAGSTSRLVDAVERLAALRHPETFGTVPSDVLTS
ncbi:MAG: hypothetical protein ACQET5_08145 [Halobacteriota archaeon]|uniref:hypothetical protein n=1 Tax=Natronomonas sp. TaxID=2184060 RepID=UPI00397547D1